MTAINLELRNIKLSKSLSEETPAYTATLFMNGRAVADLSNHGHGGCDMVRWRDRAAEATVAAHFAAMPTRRVYDFDLQPDLETWAHGVVWENDALKAMKRTAARCVYGLTADGREVTWKIPASDIDKPRADGRTVRQILTEKFPGVVFFNGMSDADLLTFIRKAGEA